MFIRTKKINNNLYAYFVENKWKNGRTVQVTKKYIGKVFSFKKVDDIDFMKFSGFEGKQVTNREILQSLVEWELSRHGFVKDKRFWKKDKLVVNPVVFSFKQGTKEIALLFNDGFLSKQTVDRILKFVISGDEQASGYKFAKYFVEAGIKIPEQVFVYMFGNLRRR